MSCQVSTFVVWERWIPHVLNSEDTLKQVYQRLAVGPAKFFFFFRCRGSYISSKLKEIKKYTISQTNMEIRKSSYKFGWFSLIFNILEWWASAIGLGLAMRPMVDWWYLCTSWYWTRKNVFKCWSSWSFQVYTVSSLVEQSTPTSQAVVDADASVWGAPRNGKTCCFLSAAPICTYLHLSFVRKRCVEYSRITCTIFYKLVTIWLIPWAFQEHSWNREQMEGSSLYRISRGQLTYSLQ